MRWLGKQLIYSPSDLITFMDSPFDSWMERFHKEFPDEVQPDPEDESHALLAKHGNTHEAAFLKHLQADGYDIVDIEGSEEIAATSTIGAMHEGRQIIYQGYLSEGQFAGRTDFLARVNDRSLLGNHQYEVWDTKLSKKAKPYFIVQLCCYAEMLKTIQGVLPEWIRVILGDRSVAEFRTKDYIYQYQQLKNSFLQFQSDFSRDRPPEDMRVGTFSKWQSYADRLLDEKDDLSRVANIRKSQIHKLQKSGISTLTDLAASSRNSILNMAPETFTTLKAQAALQLRSQWQESTAFQLLPIEAGKGLSILPPASSNDVYFDMEGYPHMEGGLEYLFGVVYEDSDDDGKVVFKDWWAHDRLQEKAAFEEFVDWIYSRWLKDPTMHIYHYAAYEVSAVRRLASRHATRIEEIDNLLRQHVFVDLYQLVRHSMQVGEPSYSIKYVEHLYREKRSGTVAKATDSVVFYERWIESQDGATWEESRILKEIRDYNEEDCISTLQLAYWLRNQQAENKIEYTGKLAEAPQVVRKMSLNALLAADLIADADSIGDPDSQRVQVLLAGLLEFHRREDKPKYWRMFDRQTMAVEELYHDLDCLAGLERTLDSKTMIKKSYGYTYSFDPDQDTKLDEGDSCFIAESLTPTRIDSIDKKNGRVTIVIGPSKPEPPARLSLIADEIVDSRTISEAIYRVGLLWQKARRLPDCLSDLLFRRVPRLSVCVASESSSESTAGIEFGQDWISQSSGTDHIATSISRMDRTCLSIQGPPGTGKTYTASRAIVHLLSQGKRVGITSNSHKAIDNLLHKVTEVARAQQVPLMAAKIGGGSASGSGRGGASITHVQNSNSFFKQHEPESFNLIAGTAWLFCHESTTELLDYLFVDEAGQVSLANVTGMSLSTKNLVLLGDQMQLEQPVEGSHPGECGHSCLEYLLQGAATIPPHMGIFLGSTHRMHPDICRVISAAVYDSRLHPYKDNHKQVLVPPRYLNERFKKRAGIVWMPVEHQGNTQASDEEVCAIEALIEDLLRCSVSDKKGSTHQITMRDILIVTPYNMQARKISHRMPGARVASVDKFQGQEAPIVILSMCASEGSSSPRGLDFLFSQSRLNVAISRAKTLAFVVGSPDLLSTPCSSLKQMKLLNFFCQIVSAGMSEEPEAPTNIVELAVKARCG